MGGVALHGLNQIGNQVQAALELHVDLRPRVVNAIAQLNEVVVHENERDGHDNDQSDDHDKGDFHESLLKQSPLSFSVSLPCAHFGSRTAAINRPTP